MNIEEKIRNLPHSPGVYIFRAVSGKVIYVGKALNLKKRVQQYFRKSSANFADPKFRSLVNSIEDIEFFQTRSENEALLLETRLIKEYSPQFNVLMRDDKRFFMIKIDLKEKIPALNLVRLKKNDGALYFGPFPHGNALRETAEFISVYFGLRVCKNPDPDINDYNHCVAGSTERCCAPCIGKTSEENYRTRINEAINLLNGNTSEIEKEIKEKMKIEAEKGNYEKAAKYRDIAMNLRSLFKPERKFLNAYIRKNLNTDSLAELQKVLKLSKLPRRIEAFDISNIAGALAVASMVVFSDGKPDKKNYRRFRIKTKNSPDDFAMMEEVIERRIKRLISEKRELPNLILIDGGKGQLSAAEKAIKKITEEKIPVAGLAKRQEEIFLPGEEGIILSRHSPALKLLQAIRDEANRFAIAYHRELRDKRIEDSILDDIPGVGKKRKILLLREFSSVENLRKYTPEEIHKRVPQINIKLLKLICDFLKK
ncbi:MAG TPA: excinuclease ABC subunit UvrC [Victivallales bacterium]|nr:excinuclease ABC subunit UvrC [Victivallales bacterium]